MKDITGFFPSVLQPRAAAVVVHVGLNYMKKGQSEMMKQDVVELINTLKGSEKQPNISGPVLSLGRGCERFSRLLALYILLKDYCHSVGITSIDNFNTF